MWPFKKKVDQSKKYVYRIEFTGVTIDGKTVTTNLDRLQELFVEAEDEISAQKEFAGLVKLPFRYIHSIKRIQFHEAFNK